MADQKEEENVQKIDTITQAKKPDSGNLPQKQNTKSAPVEPSINLKVIDNKIPPRGFLWYAIFTVIFIVATGLIIYFVDWALLFFVVVFGGVTLWRGNKGTEISLEIGSESIKINDKVFAFDTIESFYFSRIGDDFTVTFQMVKKYLPRLTFIFSDSIYVDQIRKRLGDKVPETEQREENMLDFIIRKLKL
jgi:hypothetical protein